MKCGVLLAGRLVSLSCSAGGGFGFTSNVRSRFDPSTTGIDSVDDGTVGAFDSMVGAVVDLLEGSDVVDLLDGNENGVDRQIFGERAFGERAFDDIARNNVSTCPKTFECSL
jgi:hypothetical protein